MTYQTNNHWRDFSYRCDVPEAVLESDFDYQDQDEVFDGYFKYRNWWFHLDQFVSVNSPWAGGIEFPGSPFEVHGYDNDSFFSAVLIHLSEDGEQYKIATAYIQSEV